MCPIYTRWVSRERSLVKEYSCCGMVWCDMIGKKVYFAGEKGTEEKDEIESFEGCWATGMVGR